eukprot:Tbor_TRINITY_DN5704_c0_g6::TRINITY_DN5704_c0_g6_i1::g.19623::m.19623
MLSYKYSMKSAAMDGQQNPAGLITIPTLLALLLSISHYGVSVHAFEHKCPDPNNIACDTVLMKPPTPTAYTMKGQSSSLQSDTHLEIGSHDPTTLISEHGQTSNGVINNIPTDMGTLTDLYRDAVTTKDGLPPLVPPVDVPQTSKHSSDNVAGNTGNTLHDGQTPVGLTSNGIKPLTDNGQTTKGFTNGVHVPEGLPDLSSLPKDFPHLPEGLDKLPQMGDTNGGIIQKMSDMANGMTGTGKGDGQLGGLPPDIVGILNKVPGLGNLTKDSNPNDIPAGKNPLPSGEGIRLSQILQALNFSKIPKFGLPLDKLPAGFLPPGMNLPKLPNNTVQGNGTNLTHRHKKKRTRRVVGATAISSTIPAVLITSVVFLYLYNW